MDVVLVPGLWMGASAWHDVSRLLKDAGHVPHALTLRGLDSRTADRSGQMLADHVAEIVGSIDRSAGKVVLVGHAESCGLVHAALNRRVERVAGAVYVGGLPTADGAHVLSGFTLDARGTTTNTAGYRAVDASLAEWYDRVRENSGHVIDQVQKLSDERRLDVPVTVVATEFTSDDVRRWVAANIDPARELALMRNVTLIDLPSGRWPQIERPNDVARIILQTLPVTDAVAPGAQPSPVVPQA